MTFVRENTVKAVRKPHRCTGCYATIEVGERAVRWNGMTDGYFSSAIYHPDCRAAEIDLNKLHGTWAPDEWLPLNDLDSEDRDWLAAEYPAVFARRYPDALAAATGTAKTPKAVECEASQSGGRVSERNAQPQSQPQPPPSSLRNREEI